MTVADLRRSMDAFEFAQQLAYLKFEHDWAEQNAPKK